MVYILSGETFVTLVALESGLSILEWVLESELSLI
jgi:hypothetical protein